MCVNCLSNTEVHVAQAVLVAAAVKAPVHRLLAAAGLVEAPSLARRDARTVGFLRNLDLDPVAVLGASAVARADRWVPQASTATTLGSLRPIGPQRRLATQ